MKSDKLNQSSYRGHQKKWQRFREKMYFRKFEKGSLSAIGVGLSSTLYIGFYFWVFVLFLSCTKQSRVICCRQWCFKNPTTLIVRNEYSHKWADCSASSATTARPKARINRRPRFKKTVCLPEMVIGFRILIKNKLTSVRSILVDIQFFSSLIKN